jgi:small GTP-binding protein
MKVVIVGDTQVGKTCIIGHLVTNTFKPSTPPTIGAAFQTYVMATPQGPVTMQIWDTAGQEKYRALAPMYYRSADIAILVFDVTSLQSFEGMEQWCQELSEKAPRNLQLLIAGNKVDLEDERVVHADAGNEFAKRHGAKYYGECSAKTGVGIFELFEKAAQIVAQGRSADAQTKPSTLKAQEPRAKGDGCC